MSDKGTYIYVEKSVLMSTAFKKLSGSAKYIYFQFLCKRKFVKSHSKATPVCINKRELVFDYKTAEKKHGYSASKFTRAIDELVGYGFIDVVKSGGHFKGNYTLYGLSDRWERFGKEDFVKADRGKLVSKPGLRGFTST